MQFSTRHQLRSTVKSVTPLRGHGRSGGDPAQQPGDRFRHHPHFCRIYERRSERLTLMIQPLCLIFPHELSAG